MGTIGPVKLIPLTYRPVSPSTRRRERARLPVLAWNEPRVILPILALIALTSLVLFQSNSLRVDALARGRRAISAANPPAGPTERALAAGDYGVVLNTGDGSWVVVRYEPVPDREVGVTIALDSGGRWYVNEELRLGQLRYGTLSPVEPCWSLAEAREQLRKLGFRVTPP